ncbi:MAG: hypothetical protein AB1656_10755 [Candidatus Omnitrophota bacterium]
MVNAIGLLQGQSSFGAGLISGFLNGQQIGNQNSQNQNQLINASRLNLNPLNLNQKTGLNLASPSNSAASLLQIPNKETEKSDQNAKDNDSDKVDLSNFAQEAAQQAIEQAQQSPKTGATNSIIVSADGRYEASIDLQINQDGSYDLELAVSFAQSRAAMINSSSSSSNSLAYQQDNSGDETLTPTNATGSEASANAGAVPAEQANAVPARSSLNSASASYNRYTSYEQTLETRDFQARIFYEEAKSVAVSAEQAYGSEAGSQYLSVAGEVANEFTLNISISGADINNFNSVAQDLTQFDDSGTLTGFLDAVGAVLNSDSSNLGSFLDAAQGLMSAAQEHVSSKLSGFFSDMNDKFGATLEDMGFAPDFLQNVGTDVENDLQTFFSATKNFLQNLTGSSPDAVEQKNADTQAMEALNQNLEKMREERKQLMSGDRANNPQLVEAAEPQTAEITVPEPAESAEDAAQPEVNQNNLVQDLV